MVNILQLYDCDSYNIYHFLFYLLSTLRNIELVPDIIKIDLTINKITNNYFKNNHNFVIELLQLLYPNVKINEDYLGNDNIKKIEITTVDDLNNEEIWNEKYNYLYNSFINFIDDEKFCSAMKNKYGKKIYVSRYCSKYRRVTNESDVIEHLKKYDFQILTLTGLPLLEQFYIFKNADVVISVCGAALSNTLFCKEGTKIIEINNKKTIESEHFVSIAKYRKLKFIKYINTTDVKNLDAMANDVIVNDLTSLYSE